MEEQFFMVPDTQQERAELASRLAISASILFPMTRDYDTAISHAIALYSKTLQVIEDGLVEGDDTEENVKKDQSQDQAGK